jgi:hypothetical protein
MIAILLCDFVPRDRNATAAILEPSGHGLTEVITPSKKLASNGGLEITACPRRDIISINTSLQIAFNNSC